MDDLISRAKVMDAVEDAADTVFVSFGDEEYVSVDELKRQLLALPSAQPEVIRCKNCKYHRYDGNIPYCANIDYGYGWEDNDFCSHAERQEE